MPWIAPDVVPGIDCVRTSLAPRVRQVAAALGLMAGLAGPGLAEEALQYNKDVRPILAENCFSCHGPDSASRKADLRLDKREAAIEMGAIVPKDIETSELIARIVSENADEVMPPPASHKTLTAEQKETLKRWVAEGAEYQPHWSFIAPRKLDPPAVGDESWVRGPIDRFVLKALEAKGLKPAPEADRRTLIRRVTYDLTGLPPTPEEVEAFANDTSADAYEKVVDRLLKSPRWGEHRARFWLDAARYADTHGFHFDNFREMWSYRDWVINAFNRNLPFDRFATEQLAGDLLPSATIEQKIASGFNRCNMTTNEGGTIPEEYLVLYTRDRVETTSQVFMGLTAGCAVCHDHKFDPLSQREFYEMAAFFNNTTQNAMDGNIKDTPPIVPVPRDEDLPRWEAVDAELGTTRQEFEARKQAARSEFDAWLGGLKVEQAAELIPTEGQTLRAEVSKRDAATGTPSADATLPALELANAGDFEKDRGFSVAAWVNLGKADAAGALVSRMDDRSGFRGWDVWFEGGRLGTHIVSQWPDDALKVVATAPVPVGQWTHVTLTYDGSGQAGGVKVYYNGLPQEVRPGANQLKGSIKTTVPFMIGQRRTTSPLVGVAANDLRLIEKTLTAEEADRLAGSTRAAFLARLGADQRPKGEVDALFDWWLRVIDPKTKDVRSRLAGLEKEQEEIRARGTIAHVMNEKADPAMAYILFRGDYDKRRDEVKPDTPDILPPLPSDAPKNRLGFAQWLLSADHPLTARVTVNRFWQEVFGTGFVRTSNDLGVSGELPSHPELLDWLAVDFREKGWDVKRMFREIVLSSAYRQSAVTTQEKLDKDPQNRLLSRGPRFRMDGEMIRDTALAVSGLLVNKVGGPSVRPYQPEGVWEAVAMPESNTKKYVPESGEGLYRRSLYTFWKRAAPPASMEIFNAPSRETCTIRRERTNTPLQALVTLNDPQFVEAARALAAALLSQAELTDEARLDRMAERLVARPLNEEERRIVLDSLTKLSAYYSGHEEDAAKLLAVGEWKAPEGMDRSRLAAWTMLANELMNLDEVLNK